MAETPDAFAELVQLRTEMEQVGGMVDALVRYHPEIKEQVIKEFTKEEDGVMKAIFQLIDGRKTQKEIMTELEACGVITSAPTVTRRIDRLRYLDLIVLVTRKDKSPVYIHSRLSKALGLMRVFGKLDGLNA